MARKRGPKSKVHKLDAAIKAELDRLIFDEGRTLDDVVGYPNGPRTCPCGHHEGYHADNGACLHAHQCGCGGLPAECRTPLSES